MPTYLNRSSDDLLQLPAIPIALLAPVLPSPFMLSGLAALLLIKPLRRGLARLIAIFFGFN